MAARHVFALEEGTGCCGWRCIEEGRTKQSSLHSPSDHFQDPIMLILTLQMARKLQNRLALAQFKTDRGWEDLTLDTIEPKMEEELRQRRPRSSGDVFSDSSSSTASDFHYPNSRTLLSSPLKATAIFSDQIGSSGSSSGPRKRTYNNSFRQQASSSSSSRKRFRSSPTAGRSIQSSRTSWKEQHQLAQSSPIKPRKQPHFTTSTGPNLSFFRTSHNDLSSANFAAASDDEENTLPAHSFNVRPSSPRTPSPVRGRGSLARRSKDRNGKAEEGADLLLYLATSPSPANPSVRARMQPPSTPPPRNLALPSSMMTTPGGGGGSSLGIFGNPTTPLQTFDFSDFVNITPSPAQTAFTPRAGLKTPLTVARRRLTFENFLPPNSSPTMRDHSSKSGLGMQLGGDLLP